MGAIGIWGGGRWVGGVHELKNKCAALRKKERTRQEQDCYVLLHIADHLIITGTWRKLSI